VVLTGLGAPATVIETIAWHPVRAAFYLAWLGSVAWFAWGMRKQGAGSRE
jgi:hypothetical protein